MRRINMRPIGVALATLLAASIASAAEYTIEQSNKSFLKDGQKIEQLTIQTGDTIHFKNQDPFFHNIFSLSELKTFDLGSYPAGEFKSVTFEKPGKAEIECAIHPEMYMEVDIK